MFFQYETTRLLLKVLRADCAPQVLDFYNRDKELFEMYEIDRVPDFYTVKHLQKVLRYEYSMAVKSQLFRFYVFQKENRAGLSALCVYIISLRLSTEAVKLAINFPVSFTTWGMPLRQSASAPSLPLMSFACTR